MEGVEPIPCIAMEFESRGMNVSCNNETMVGQIRGVESGRERIKCVGCWKVVDTT